MTAMPHIKALQAAFFVAGICSSFASSAAITFVDDGADLLRGSFLLSGSVAVSEVLNPTVFRLLPDVQDGVTDGVYACRRCGDSMQLAIRTENEGKPDDPMFRENLAMDNESNFASLSGIYTNSGQVAVDGTPVYWRISELRDSGGLDGTFSGNFCFSTNPAGCSTSNIPEPGTVTLLGLGLAGLAASRRRKR